MFNCRFYNKAEACDSTDSTARRDNEVRLFFWIGMKCIKKVTQRVGWVENPTSPQAV